MGMRVMARMRMARMRMHRGGLWIRSHKSKCALHHDPGQSVWLEAPATRLTFEASCPAVTRLSLLLVDAR